MEDTNIHKEKYFEVERENNNKLEKNADHIVEI